MKFRAPLAVICLFGADAAADGQTAPAGLAEDLLLTARDLYAVPLTPRPDPCPQSSSGEIVVCGDVIDPATQKMPSPADLGSTKDIVPRAPNLGPPPCVPNLLTYCSDPPPLRSPLIIDLSAIPEAPPGSDAERIAKGDMPAP